VVTPPPAAGQQAFTEGHKRLVAGDADGALGFLSQAVTEAADNPQYQWAYGQALVRTGSAEEGLAAMEEAARLDPPRYRLNYAKALGLQGRDAQAAAEFEAILEASPDDPEALWGAGFYLSKQKDYAKGLPLLKRAAELRPSDPNILKSLAGIQAFRGDYPEAASAYGRIVLLNPADHAARAMLADSLFKQGRTEDAIQTLKAGIARDPNAAELQRDLGATLERAGRPAEAAAAYREYARLVPDAADAAELLKKADRLAPGGS
jgi:predicted Zn-dependent protease